jgi:diguanylate cyclase (GGDEF)-like protein
MPRKPPSDPPLYDQATFAQRSEVLDIVLDHVPQGIVVIGPDYRLLAFNKPILPLFHLTEGSFRVGRDFREIIDVWVRETGQDEAMRMRALAELDMREPFTFELEQQVHGETRWVVLTHDPLPGGGCVRTFTDITEHKRLEQKLLTLSRTDALTGLLNRGTFLEAAADELARAQRYGRPLSFLGLDLDHFKLINDRYGHPAGDRVLQVFAHTLAGCLRQHDHVGRMGGEEFAVLLPELTLEQAAETAERVLATVRELALNGPGGNVIGFTVSIGVAQLAPAEELNHLLSRVDKALYRAKGDGRDCYRVAADD